MLDKYAIREAYFRDNKNSMGSTIRFRAGKPTSFSGRMKASPKFNEFLTYH